MAIPNQLANEIIPRLWLGNRNAATNADWLQGHGIEVVFNASKDIPFTDLPLEKYRIPVDDNLEDVEIVNMAKWSPEIVYNVLREYQAGKRILIHCAAGVQRSAAITAMTLVALQGMDADQAIQFIKSRRQIAFYPAVNFYKSIRTFEEYYSKVLRPQLTAATAAAATNASVENKKMV
jgi:protein-tyrosine phosphatase